MSLQRISDFAEIQEKKHFFEGFGGGPWGLHSEVFA